MKEIVSSVDNLAEEVRIVTIAHCFCGRPLTSERSSHEPAGSVSLLSLSDLAIRARQLNRCKCGALLTRGEVLACYRLPGRGPWIAASCPLSGAAEVELSLRDRLPRGGAGSHLIAFLRPSELEAALRLGQPSSPQTAWKEALASIQMGFFERAFHCGPGLRCIVTRDRNRSHDYDLRALVGGMPDWLTVAGASDPAVYFYLQVDRGTIEQELHAEAERAGLEVVADPVRQGVVLRRPGERFSCPIDIDAFVADAVVRGLTPRLRAEHLTARLSERLAQLEQATISLETRLGRNVRTNGRALFFHRDAGDEVHFDVSAYLAAPAAERELLLDRLVGAYER